MKIQSNEGNWSAINKQHFHITSKSAIYKIPSTTKIEKDNN